MTSMCFQQCFNQKKLVLENGCIPKCYNKYLYSINAIREILIDEGRSLKSTYVKNAVGLEE